MGAPMGAAPAAPPTDDGLAASPWNTANNPGFNRDLLPSAMVAPAPEPPPSKRPDKHPEPAAEAPSRTPWIIVGVLVLVAVAGGVAVLQIRGRHGKDGQIAVPAGATTADDDTPADTEAPTATTATAKPKAAPVVHPVYRPKPVNNEDPYADPYGPSRSRPASPAPTPTVAPHRIFGTEN